MQELSAGLIQAVTVRILARGETAFLHAYTAKAGAIGLYESLGFAVRSPMTFTLLGSGIAAGHG